MTNELTVTGDGGLEAIKAMTGEATAPQGTQFITFNGDKEADGGGKFYQGTGEAKVEIGTEINGTILRVATKVETKYLSKISNVVAKSAEVMSTQGGITLYDNFGTEIETGEYQDLKAKYDLGFKQILYISLDEMNGEVVKLSVGGGSLSPLWDYLKLPGKDGSIVQFKTKFEAESYKADTGVFHKLKLTKTGDNSKEELQTQLDNLSKLGVPAVKTAEKALPDGAIIDENGNEIPFKS